VARFVGTDRGLKRLSLLTVAEAKVQSGVVARVGEDARAAWRRALEAENPWVLLLDRDDRPQGWMRVEQLAREGPLAADSVDASSPLVHYETTLRDALSMLLASAVQTAVVIDERGRYAGILTLDELAIAFRSDAEPRAVAGRLFRRGRRPCRAHHAGRHARVAAVAEFQRQDCVLDAGLAGSRPPGLAILLRGGTQTARSREEPIAHARPTAPFAPRHSCHRGRPSAPPPTAAATVSRGRRP